MKLLIADDHGIVRGGLRVLLEQQPDIQVIAEAEDGQQALELALQHRPDICVLDVSMPKLTGLQVALELHRQAPEISVLMLSMHDDDRYLFEALKAGASGYVLKREADQFLVDAVRSVAGGTSFLTNAAQGALVRSWLNDDAATPQEPLSPREQEVLKLIAEGLSSKEIASELGVSLKTVDSHRSNLMEKLDIHKVSGLVRFAIRAGMVEA